MVDREREPNPYVRSAMKPHEEFLELCALATSGNLTEEEQRTLRDHLAICPECREAMKQFEAVVDRGIPALAPELARETPEEDPSWSAGNAEAGFFGRLSREDSEKARFSSRAGTRSPAAIQQKHAFRKTFDRLHLWLPLAAGALFSVATTSQLTG